MESEQFVHFSPKVDCDGVFIILEYEKIIGSDFDFDENGVMVERTPEFDEVWTLSDGSFRSGSRGEIEQSIDEMLINAEAAGCLEEMLELLNSNTTN